MEPTSYSFLFLPGESRCKGCSFYLRKYQPSSPSCGYGLFGFSPSPCWCGCASGVRSWRRKEDLLLLVSHSLVKMPGLERKTYSEGSLFTALGLSLSEAADGTEYHPFCLLWDCNCIGVWWCDQPFSLAHWPNCNRGGKIFSLPSPQNIEIFKGNPGGRLAS